MGRNTERIAMICQQHGINRLYLVGSASRHETTPASDVDLLVHFGPTTKPLEQYLDAKRDFEQHFANDVDLIEAEAVTNPHFKHSLDEDKVLLYEAG